MTGARLFVAARAVRSILRLGLRRILTVMGIVLTAGSLVLAAGLFWSYTTIAQAVPDQETILTGRDTGLVLLDRTGRPFFTFYAGRAKHYVPLAEIADTVERALIAAEDKHFPTHPGYSTPAIARAFYTNLTRQAITTGASTITQQLAKIALLSPERSYQRKYKEVIIASELERRYTKDQILEMYLNSVYFGEGAFGVEPAAQTYFGKPASALSLSEASFLVGILPAPSALSPLGGDPAPSRERQRYVLDEMVRAGMITSADKEGAIAQELRFQKQPDIAALNSVAPHFALLVRDQLIAQYGETVVAGSGWRIRTTIDLDTQKQAQAIIAQQVANLASHQVGNGAAVVLRPTSGEIIALVGSRDWNDESMGKINMAIAPRQPGSSFKPLLYATAIDQNVINAGTVLHDQPTVYTFDRQRYQPKNYDNRFRGNVLPRRALANSLNVPAVEVIAKLGVPTMLESAQRFGITTLTPPERFGLSLALGAGEIPLTELTAAYAGLANGGQAPMPATILEITDRAGHTMSTFTPQFSQSVSPQAAYIITSFLADPTARREVFGRALTTARTAAVKTGTTSDYKDAWTLGYTQRVAVGVWIGNNDATPMDRVAGALGAAPAWRELLETFSANDPPDLAFHQPEGLIAGKTCGGISQLDLYIVGTQPLPCPPPPPREPAPAESPAAPAPEPPPAPTASLEKNE